MESEGSERDKEMNQIRIWICPTLKREERKETEEGAVQREEGGGFTRRVLQRLVEERTS